MSPEVQYAAPSAAYSPDDLWRSAFLTLRPQHWVKNALIFIPLLFSHSLVRDGSVRAELLAFTAFCLLSSAVYVFNDLRDRVADRRHPVKRNRPIAAGRISQPAAILIMAGLLGAALAAALQVTQSFQLVALVYLALNLGYSLGLKRIVILDAMIVSLGFVLRALAGSYAINVPATQWLILCTFMLALMLSFGKRFHEINLLQGPSLLHRNTLHEYSPRMLEMLVGMCGTAALITYALYTTADATLERFGSRNMLLTIPFVVFGLFRYIFLLYGGQGGDPARLFWRDTPTLLNAFAWALTAALVIYGPLTRDLL